MDKNFIRKIAPSFNERFIALENAQDWDALAIHSRLVGDIERALRGDNGGKDSEMAMLWRDLVLNGK